MARSSLNIFLVKDGLEFKEIFKDNFVSDYKAKKISLSKQDGIQGFGYICETQSDSPTWLKDLKHLTNASGVKEIDNLSKKKSSFSALLHITNTKKKRTFLICFGYGKKLIRDDCYVRNFGRNVVLNATDETKVLSIRRQTYEGKPWYKESQAASVSGIQLFDLNCDYELLNRITAELDVTLPKSFVSNKGKKDEKEHMSRKLTGHDSVNVNCEIDQKKLFDLTKWLYERFVEKKYKDIIKNIDTFQEVKDKTRSSERNKDLINLLVSKDESSVSLIIPEFIDHEEIDNFELVIHSQKHKLGNKYSISDFYENYFNVARKGELTLDTIKNKCHIIGMKGNDFRKKWSIYNCLTCEVEDENKEINVLMNRSWFIIEKNFLNRVIKNLNRRVDFKNQLLPSCKVKNEDLYNKGVAKLSNFEIYDKKLATTTQGGGIEPCDLLHKNSNYIHVKRVKASHDMSHLLAQAYVSTELLVKRDEEFIKGILSKTSHANKSKVEKNIKNRSFDVTLGIIIENRKSIDQSLKIKNLPIFSIINLNRTIEDIETYQSNGKPQVKIELLENEYKKKTTVLKKKAGSS